MGIFLRIGPLPYSIYLQETTDSKILGLRLRCAGVDAVGSVKGFFEARGYPIEMSSFRAADGASNQKHVQRLVCESFAIVRFVLAKSGISGRRNLDKAQVCFCRSLEFKCSSSRLS